MALRHSRMTELGAAAPDFALPDPSGKIVKKSDYAGRPLLVAFICNHCKYVQHIREGFAAFAGEYAEKGLAIVAISANDVSTHPDDRPEENARVARQFGYVFPYLHDETQETALAYEAICTPDFFLLDRDGRLAY